MIDIKSVSVGDVVRLSDSEDARVVDLYKGVYGFVAEIDPDHENIIRVELPEAPYIREYGKECVLTGRQIGTFKTWLSCEFFDPTCDYHEFSESQDLISLFEEDS